MKIRHSSHALPRDDARPSSDAVSVISWQDGFLAVLADGAGTTPEAREAAERSVHAVATHYRTHPLGWTPGKALRETVKLIHRSLWNESMARLGRAEMVCTLVVALYDEGFLTYLSIGDSRLYLLREEKLLALTQDDTDPAEPLRLLRALGAEEYLKPVTEKMSIQEGDILFLCSDGIHHHLSDEEIGELLRGSSSARLIAKHARDHSPEETRDDCAAIRIEIDELGWSEKIQDRQLPVLDKPKSGMKIDGWTLMRSFGANDRCWLAEREGCRQVMKFAPAGADDQPWLLQAFLRETWNAVRFSEETVFVRAWEPPNRSSLYYNMEFIDAPGLNLLLRERPLQVDEAAKLALFLTEASMCLLRHNLLHGDLKPENILVENSYHDVKFRLIDLGSCCEVFSQQSRSGTASYLAPERFHQAPISERTEIFSIGVTLYQVLTGKMPFGEIERFQTPVFSSPKSPGQINPLIPPWLDALILRCCAIRPEQRYQHFSELLFDLNHPSQVKPWQKEFSPLIERNPVLFWKCAAVASWLILLAIIWRWMSPE
jgi:serine/threonine protein kinase